MNRHSVVLIVAAGISSWLPAPWMHAAAAETAAAAPTLRITKSSHRLDPTLSRAFAELQAGNLAAAELDYARTLKSEPGNRDALHGAAVVALRLNQRERAEDFYRRAIAFDPNDAIAQAGLAGLRGPADATITESRLKSLLAAQPDEHCLQFALGNIYAATGRWRDAQQAFFRAYSAAPDHPDYLFNLAVSLDQLRQAGPARRFYEQAIAAADRQPANFDAAQAAARLRELAR